MADEEADAEDSLETTPEDLLEEDEITDQEEGFMKGYDEVAGDKEEGDAKEEKETSDTADDS